MVISSLHVRLFRSIYDETLHCEPLTILIGRNGAGKSAFVQALRLFMDTSATLRDEDYYDRNTAEQLLIEVTFSSLNPDEEAEFASYIESGTLVVQRRFPGGDYYGMVSGCEDFEPIRERLRQKAKVGEVASDLQQLVSSGRFPGLKAVSRSIEDELNRWESENPVHCKRYFRSGVFQGPTNIAGGKLRNRTQFVYVAPVREAEVDATGGGRQSALTTLVAPLVKAIADTNSAVQTARQSLEDGYGSYKSAIESAQEKSTLEAELTSLLQRYEGETSAHIQLSLEDKLPLPPVTPRVLLDEDGFEGEVARKGHGLQRLFIFSILELYEKLRGRTPGEDPGGSMVLAIEEPELYQHPARARALARVLAGLSKADEERPFQFQVFLTTHSPYFVGLDSFQSIRRIHKEPCSSGPKQTRVTYTTLKCVGDDVLNALGRPTDATELSSWARLRSVLGPSASEAFFADGIVLVEGDEDEAIVAALAESKGVSMDAAGVAVVPAGGKTKLPSLLALYRRLGIRVFTIFDGDAQENSDAEAKTEFNSALLKMVGQPEQARPATTIGADYAVWDTTFTRVLTAAFGADKWEAANAEARSEYSIAGEQAKKKYAGVWRAMTVLLGQNPSCDVLDRLWTAMAALLGLSRGSQNAG